MKIEIKKIALVMVVGILSFCWSFGLEQDPSQGMQTGLIQPLPKFTIIKVINYIKGQTADLSLNEGVAREEKITIIGVGNKRPKTIKLKGDGAEIRQIRLSLDGEQLPNKGINWNSDGTRGEAIFDAFKVIFEGVPGKTLKVSLRPGNPIRPIDKRNM